MMKLGVVLVVVAVVGVAMLVVSRSSDDAYENWSPHHRRLGARQPRSLAETVNYIVTFEDRFESPRVRCAALAKAKGGTVLDVFDAVNACSIKMPRAQGEVSALNSDASVMFEEDQPVWAFEPEEIETTHVMQRRVQQTESTSLWGLDRINQCTTSGDSKATSQDASNVVVYIIDTGIKGDHTEFTGMMGPTSCHFSAISSETNPLTDGNSHGTHVAGTVCGKTYGVASTSNKCMLCAVKTLSSAGTGSSTGVVKGINHVIKNCKTHSGKRCVINMSLGGDYSSAQNNAVAAAVDAGIVVVVAAGNSNKDACNYSPASSSKVITVGSTTSTDAKSGFSNWGSCLDIWAPGSGILSAGITSTSATSSKSGTSMASPHVAGIAVGILAKNNALTPAEVRDWIVNRADIVSSTIKLATVVDINCSGARSPTNSPTSSPTLEPTQAPTSLPTMQPTTRTPTERPTALPTTIKPTANPTTRSPSISPTNSPTSSPTFKPTRTPTSLPTMQPTTRTPTERSTARPTTLKPTANSTTSSPSRSPTNSPTSSPTLEPTQTPTSTPTSKPTTLPTSEPTTLPMKQPTTAPNTPASSVGVNPTPTLVPTYEPVTLATAKCTPNGSPTQRKCYKQNGNMFSIDANVNVVLTSITISVSTGTGAEVWTKVGDYIGFETNKTAWKKVGVSRFSNTVGMKSIKLSQVVNVRSGSRQSIYVTMTTNTSYVFYGGNYTGTPSSSQTIQQQQQSGSSVQNDDIVINMGTANEYPFVRVIAPRYFNGEVVYRKTP